MLEPTEAQTNEMRRFAFILEKQPYDGVRQFLKSLSREEFIIFWQYFFDFDLLGIIASHKNGLAEVVARTGGVIALPEDRKRIVFALAKLDKTGFSEATTILKNELGPNFKLANNYTFGSNVKNWQEVVQRAKEIENGYVNLSSVAVETQVAGVLRFYKIPTETDPEKIKYLENLAIKVLSHSIDRISLPPSAPEAQKVLPMIIEFYKATNRLQLDIDELSDAPDLEDAIDYITVSKMIYETKLALIAKGIPLTDFVAVENYIRREMSHTYYLSNFVTTEEILRHGQPLQPAKLPVGGTR